MRLDALSGLANKAEVAPKLLWSCYFDGDIAWPTPEISGGGTRFYYQDATGLDTLNNGRTNLLAALASTSVMRRETFLIPSTDAVVTMTIANPAVVNWTANILIEDEPIKFSTTGALPTGIVAGTTYYAKNVTANNFQVAATVGGAAITTSGSQSGTHTCTAIADIVNGSNADIAAVWTNGLVPNDHPGGHGKKLVITQLKRSYPIWNGGSKPANLELDFLSQRLPGSMASKML